MKVAIIVTISVFIASAEPAKHLFRHAGTLTEASGLPARRVADDFLRVSTASLGLSPGDLAGVYVWKEYKTAHNGVTHFVYRQQYDGIEVHGAEWVVNVDRAGRVINAGGNLSAAPGAGVTAPSFLSARSAVRAAVMDMNPRLGESFVPFEAAAATASQVSFHWTADTQIPGRPVWHLVNGALRPSWAFVLTDEDGITSYETIVDAEGHRVVEQTPLTFFQNPPKALVFTEQSPQPNPNPGWRLTEAPAIAGRKLVPLTGSAPASPIGWVAGVETAGNNALAGWNPEGIRFAAGPRTAVSPARDFSFPLELGGMAPNPIRFADAATVNLFYWVNRAHDLFHEIGFDEAAGNFQQDNFGRGGSGGDPMLAYSQFGHAAPGIASLNNAFFTTRNISDGNASMIAMFLSTNGGSWIDGSYDSEVIVHEYTHGVTTRLLRGYGSHQTAAMGEAWSDFYSLEFTIPEGAPADGWYPEGEYFSQSFGSGIRTRPYSTDLKVNPLTYTDLGRVTTAPQVHADGEIWMQALWQMRANLIRQFGEREGRRRVRVLVLDGLKLSPPAPSYVNMRDAILLADQAGFQGESQNQIWSAFASRGLGVLAQSAGANTTHILPSFETPSQAGSMRFYEPVYTLGETVRVVLHDANLETDVVAIQFTASSGDVEQIDLRRQGMVWLGSMSTTGATTVNRGDGVLSAMPGDFITGYYLDRDPGGEARQIEVTVPTRPSYTLVTAAPRFEFTGETRLNFRATSFTSRRVELPFPFPFFGSTYSTARLYSNGLLAFGLPPSVACADGATLARITGIAGLWMEMQTNGFAQPNEDVYVSEGSDSVTYRWVAETANFLQPTVTFPVNVALTLFRDGRIQFHYGPGNQSLAVGFSPFGCAPSTPVVGISSGTETFSQVAPSHSGNPNLSNAATVTFLPPFGQTSIPVGILESPGEGGVARGILSLRGVAYDEAVPVTRIDVLIDGVWRGRTTASATRADFCAEQQVRGCPFVGFNLNLDIGALRLAPGAHSIQLRATNANGAFVEFPETPIGITVESGQSKVPFGLIETPVNDSDVAGSVLVRGYAAAEELRVAAVDIIVDGINYGRASYGQGRNEICSTLDPRPLNCPGIGFTFTLNTRTGIPLANGEHALQIRIQDETGRFTLIPETPVTIRVDNERNQPPQGVLVAPVHNEPLSSVVAVYGHAWDSDGRVTQVQLLVNGEIRETIPYGRPRPEECAALPEVEACPEIGFEFGLDTRRLNNGPNVIGIRLVDDGGASVVLPKTLRNGINVFIRN